MNRRGADLAHSSLTATGFARIEEHHDLVNGHPASVVKARL